MTTEPPQTQKSLALVFGGVAVAVLLASGLAALGVWALALRGTGPAVQPSAQAASVGAPDAGPDRTR